MTAVLRETRADKAELLLFHPNRSGFTLPEVLVSMGIVGILVAVTLPGVQQIRERARATQCMSNLRQFGEATHTHETFFQVFPYTSTTWWDSRSIPARRFSSVSAHQYLMSSIDDPTFRQTQFGDGTAPIWALFPPQSFVSFQNTELQKSRFAVFSCPSDRTVAGATSYRSNLGISASVLPPGLTIEKSSQRGAFVNGRALYSGEFTDGLSNTAMFCERVVGDYRPSQYTPFRDFFATGTTMANTHDLALHCAQAATTSPRYEYSFAGGSWLLGGWLNTWYNHVLTPNSRTPDCGFGPCCTDGGNVIVTARSFHLGGVNCAMADGSVRFVAEDVDSMVWLAVGTRDGGETSGLK